jgi:hypothetical protein
MPIVSDGSGSLRAAAKERFVLRKGSACKGIEKGRTSLDYLPSVEIFNMIPSCTEQGDQNKSKRSCNTQKRCRTARSRSQETHRRRSVNRSSLSYASTQTLALAEQSRTLDSAGQARLTELRAEVVRIKKAKEEYVAAHPEHRKFVYAHEEARDQARKAANAGEGSSAGGDYDKLGRLRDPTRSVYYDPVFNPFGVPPPGMPYLEKRESITEWEGSGLMLRG